MTFDQADANSIAIILLGVALIVHVARDHRRTTRVTPILCRLGIHWWQVAALSLEPMHFGERCIRCSTTREIRGRSFFRQIRATPAFGSTRAPSPEMRDPDGSPHA